MNKTVIAIASTGQPLKRMLMEVESGLLYLANPDRLEAVEAGRSDPVGFPPQDVFEFEEGVFGELDLEWNERQRLSPAALAMLRPFRAGN